MHQEDTNLNSGVKQTINEENLKTRSEQLREDLIFNHGSENTIRNYLQRTLSESSTSESTRMVVPHVQESGREFGVERERPVSMARIAESSSKDFEYLASEIKEMGSNFFDYVTGKDIKGSWRYISDVILFESMFNCNRIVERLREYGRSRRTGMFGFSVESNHIHVIHDCAYSDGSCRDKWRREVEPFGTIRPARTQNKQIYKFTATDWYDVFIYFFLSKRGTREIYTRGESWTPPTDFELVRWEKEFNTRGQMVRSKADGSDTNSERSENNRTRRAATSAPTNEVYGKKSKIGGKYSYIKSKTKVLLMKYYCSPVSSIRDVKEFREDDMLSDPKNKDYLQSAFDDFGKDRNDMTLRDIYDTLTEVDCTPLFIMSMQYGDLEESTEWIDNLLKFQFNEDEERICQFLTSLVDVVDKKLPKCNAFLVISPPNAGKNFFFDMLFALCLNYGQLGQANKYNVFAFQEAPNKRILLWNEPNYEPGLTDVIKMMMGGDPYTVRVKNQMDCHVRRTPVIILTNNVVPFMAGGAFSSRIVQFRWKAAPQLKNIELKPNPMCLFKIFNKYNIEFYIIVFYYVGGVISGPNSGAKLVYKPCHVAPSSLGFKLNAGIFASGSLKYITSPGGTFAVGAHGYAVFCCSITCIVAVTSQYALTSVQAPSPAELIKVAEVVNAGTG